MIVLGPTIEGLPYFDIVFGFADESVKTEGRVLDVLIRSGCKRKDLKEVSNLLSIIYGYGFEVGKRCVKE